jgi:hypothetical protein
MSNFLGKDGYTWWVGVVENIEDPLKIGRCKIRIFGWHTENLQLLPTKDLPWAAPAQSTNGSNSFSVPTPGDYVTGYFADVGSGQNPYYTAVLPGIQANPPDTSKGFSPQRLDPAAAPTVVEKATPKLPDGVVAKAVGMPTIAPTAMGIIANTGISLTNASLGHACDFRYAFNFNLGVGSLGLINPVTAIQNAMKSGKNKAAMLISAFISQLNDKFRLTIKGILFTLNLDPSGVLAGAYSYLKKIVRMINEITVKIAKMVEIVSAVYYLIQDIQKIIDYLKTLPARFLAMVQDCISNFLGGIKNFTSQILSIPGAVGNSIQDIAKSLTGSADSMVSTLNAAAASNPLPDALKDLFTNPSLDHTTVLEQHINDTYDANTVIATAKSSNFDPNKVQWA